MKTLELRNKRLNAVGIYLRHRYYTAKMTDAEVKEEAEMILDIIDDIKLLKDTEKEQ